jgi:hypothetical protein
MAYTAELANCFAFGDVLFVLIQKVHKKIKVKVMLLPALGLFLKISKVG